MIELHLQNKGPVFDARANRIVDRFVYEAEDEVALRAGITVVQELQRVVKHPTPYYWTQIQVDRQVDHPVVHDGGVIYGPWLAGVGSRNKSTRFKGYQHWRKAVQEMRRRAPEMAARLLNVKYIKELNGDGS